jgi:hypothetical protein
VQELVNAQYHRADSITETLTNLLEAKDVAKLKESGELYITAGYLAARLGEDSTRDKNMCARMLSAASTSPTFPFRLVNQRKRLPQLIMTEGQRYGYTQGINNDQLMINGYIATRK